MLAAIAMAHLVPAEWRAWADNVHWTLGYSGGAFLAWRGVRQAQGDARRARRAFAWGLTAFAAGQIAWDIQVAAHWNPFPGPSDALYLVLGPACAIGLASDLRARLTANSLWLTALDAAGFVIGGVALVLALYLPLRHDSSLLQMCVLVAYPGGMIAAAALGLMYVLALRLRPRWNDALFIGTLFAQAALWMRWNALTLSGGLQDGTWYNAAFSVVTLAQGYGAMRWAEAPRQDPRWASRLEVAQFLLPTFVVIGAALAVFIVSTQPTTALVRQCIEYGAGVVILIALARQYLLFVERARMRGAEVHFRTMFDSAADAILVMEGMRFVDCNASAERMFGLSRERLLGVTPADISPSHQPDGRVSAEAAAQIMARVRAGEGQRFEWRHRRADGGEFETEVQLDRVQLPERDLVQAVVRDITERRAAERQRRELEERLRHTSRLESVGRLAGGVAHDFNNILTVVMGTADLALLRGGLDERVRHDLEEIRSSSQRAAKLTAQLLAFSRQQVITPVPCEIDGLVTDALSMLQRLIGEDVHLRFEPARDRARVLCDPTQIEQVLVNLAANARDAMPHGGTLSMATRLHFVPDAPSRRPDGVLPGSYVCLSVSDTGEGIPAEIRDHIFEPFFTTKEFGRGTGLGLATVYGIVSQSGGFIEVDSTPGGGTTFRVLLPLLDRAASAPAAGARQESRRGHESILLCEDEPAVRTLASRMLRDLGYEVREAGDGEHALALAAEQDDIALLVTDVIMPGMSGRELHTRLCAKRPGLPVVYMSGYTDQVLSTNGELDAGLHFVQKPFSAVTLAAAVRAALDAPAPAAQPPAAA